MDFHAVSLCSEVGGLLYHEGLPHPVIYILLSSESSPTQLKPLFLRAQPASRRRVGGVEPLSTGDPDDKGLTGLGCLAHPELVALCLAATENDEHSRLVVYFVGFR